MTKPEQLEALLQLLSSAPWIPEEGQRAISEIRDAAEPEKPYSKNMVFEPVIALLKGKTH